MVKRSPVQKTSPQIAIEDPRPRRCDTAVELQYDEIKKDKLEPVTSIEVIYKNQEVITLAVREVLESGSLIVMGRPSIFTLDHIAEIRSLNTDGVRIIEEIHAKIQTLFETTYVKTIGGKGEYREEMDSLERREKVSQLTQESNSILFGNKIDPEQALNNVIHLDDHRNAKPTMIKKMGINDIAQLA